MPGRAKKAKRSAARHWRTHFARRAERGAVRSARANGRKCAVSVAFACGHSANRAAGTAGTGEGRRVTLQQLKENAPTAGSYACPVGDAFAYLDKLGCSQADLDDV